MTERGGLNSHAAIVGMALDIPVIVFAENATAILKSSSVVEVDASAVRSATAPGQNKTLAMPPAGRHDK